MIPAEARRDLLHLARKVVERAAAGERYVPDVPPSGVLAEHRGAFVTLTRGSRLRGCIGRIVADQPLVTTVADMAAAAARDDFRFDPVRPDEVDGLTIEISALSPIREVHDPLGEIEVGRHGLIIRQGPSSGLLLPQVAADAGWTVERFLDETCRKAGLPANAWREGATVEAFEAEVWGEEEDGERP